MDIVAVSLTQDEPQIAEYIRGAVLEIMDPNVLKQVVDELDGINFSRLGLGVKGNIFEYLLGEMLSLEAICPPFNEAVHTRRPAT